MSARTNKMQLQHIAPNPIKKITQPYHEAHITPSFGKRVPVHLDPSDGFSLCLFVHAVLTSFDLTTIPRRLRESEIATECLRDMEKLTLLR